MSHPAPFFLSPHIRPVEKSPGLFYFPSERRLASRCSESSGVTSTAAGSLTWSSTKSSSSGSTSASGSSNSGAGNSPDILFAGVVNNPIGVTHVFDKLGNTGAASVIILMDEERQSGRLKDGDLCLLSAFGAATS